MSTTKIPASRCNRCEKVIVPPRDICPYCRMTPIDFINLSNVGSVLSFTKLLKPPEGFLPPLKMALVELEFGAIVLCLQEGEDEGEIAIGSRVELTIDDKERFLFHMIS